MYVNPHFSATERVFPNQGRYAFKRYDMNENPEGLPNDFVEKVKRSITPEFLATYPEPKRFVEKYAHFIGVAPENIMTTNGSDMAIRYLLETFGEPSRNVVTVTPSFEMYRINCSLLGLNHIPVQYNDDLSFDITRLYDAIDSNTSIVSILNPNNPIGNTFTAAEVETIIQKAQSVGALVILDEAYHYFYDVSFIPFVEKYDNVVVLRTFSKCFSIAGCRLGVIIGSEAIMKMVARGRLTFDVNSIALLFGEALLDEPEILKHLITTEKKGKAHLISELEKNGYSYMGGAGNYIFIQSRLQPKQLETKLKDQYGILIKTFGHPMLSKYIRVSTGSVNSMNSFLNAFFVADN